MCFLTGSFTWEYLPDVVLANHPPGYSEIPRLAKLYIDIFMLLLINNINNNIKNINRLDKISHLLDKNRHYIHE